MDTCLRALDRRWARPGRCPPALWLSALAVLYAVTWFGFPLPGLGRSLTTDYTISGEHMAQRCYLFITIALGESILVIGSQFGELPRASTTVAAFVIAFVGSVGFWWIYFDRSAEAATEVISTASDPGRLGVVAYTYLHIPMVAGIIVAAAGYEVAIAHPRNQVDLATACLILGGPALFLVGETLFKRALWGHVSVSPFALDRRRPRTDPSRRRLFGPRAALAGHSGGRCGSVAELASDGAGYPVTSCRSGGPVKRTMGLEPTTLSLGS